jgi:guanylate kinase
MINKKQGNLFIISAASGAGKTSLVKKLLTLINDLTLSISHTTRDPRPSEIDGKDYFFVTNKIFEAMIKEDKFLETAKCHGSFYGTSRNFVEEVRDAGKDIIFEIDWQGAKSIKAIFPEAISIFILPPSLKKLEERLTARGQDSEDTIKARLSAAKSEMSHVNQFDYVTINDKFDDALEELQSIIMAEKLNTKYQTNNYQELIDQLTK